jgi:hypothetical protein
MKSFKQTDPIPKNTQTANGKTGRSGNGFVMTADPRKASNSVENSTETGKMPLKVNDAAARLVSTMPNRQHNSDAP